MPQKISTDAEQSSESESVPSEPRQSPPSSVAAARDHFQALANRFESSVLRDNGQRAINTSSSLSRLAE